MENPNRSHGSLAGAIALMLGAAGSNQVGAAFGAKAFPSIGPAGVVAVRQLVAAAVLLPAGRPPLRRMTRAQWWPTLLLALVFATMNLSLYTAISRIGLALAVTLEFIGPLAIALLGSHSRRDLATAVLVGVGVYVLVLPDASSDWWGITLGLIAAGCWAAYIVLNRMVGKRLPGLQAPAAATTVTSLLYLPVLVTLQTQHRLFNSTLGYAIAAGVLSSAVPYALDLLALRRVAPRLFGMFMSAHPVMAALAGLLILGQSLALHELVGIATVVAANVYTVSHAQRNAG